MFTSPCDRPSTRLNTEDTLVDKADTGPAFMSTSIRNLEVWAYNCPQKHKSRRWKNKVSPFRSPKWQMKIIKPTWHRNFRTKWANEWEEPKDKAQNVIFFNVKQQELKNSSCSRTFSRRKWSLIKDTQWQSTKSSTAVLWKWQKHPSNWGLLASSQKGRVV